MGNVAKRPDGRWRARYRDAAGKEHAKHFDRKIDAQRWLNEVTASVATGQYVDPRAGRVTLAEYSVGWQSSHVGSEGTARIVDNALRLHILPRLGQRPMHALRRSDVQALVKGLSETHSAGTVRNVYDVLARVLAAAVEDRVVASSPCRRVVLPRLDDAEVRPPSVEDVVRVADAMPRRYRAAVVLLAGSGLRVGELLGLQVTDVHFLGRSVRVERQRMQDGRIAPTKSPKSVRTVPLGAIVVDELAAHLAACPSSGPLFTTSAGEPLGYRTWKQLWAAMRRSTGLDDLNTHDLRHFFASALIAGGASVKQVQTVLGHASAVITLRTYAHLWPGDEDRTRTIVDSTLAVLRTDCGPTAASDHVSAGQNA